MVRANRTISGKCVIGWVCVSLLAAGCQSRQWMLNPEGLPNGLVIVLPGIDGRAAHNEVLSVTLRRSQPEMAVEHYDWTAPLGPLFNQCAYEHNRAKARQLADRIVQYHGAYPGGRVYLIGHSGGTAIAAWAAEALPEGDCVEGIILLASSLSPGYDLSGALAHSRQGVVNFYSDRDAALLGLGTALAGSMDRQFTESAGKVGFRCPHSAGRLLQIPWTPDMAKAGHDGSHFSVCSARFVAGYVAPFLKGRTWEAPALAQAAPAEPTAVAAASEFKGQIP
jgi:pimeloyl-ACP methyl ester carboxylesterase